MSAMERMRMSDSANKTRALRCRENIRLQDSMGRGGACPARLTNHEGVEIDELAGSGGIGAAGGTQGDGVWSGSEARKFGARLPTDGGCVAIEVMRDAVNRQFNDGAVESVGVDVSQAVACEGKLHGRIGSVGIADGVVEGFGEVAAARPFAVEKN